MTACEIDKKTRLGRKSFQRSFRAALSSGLIFGTSGMKGFPIKPLAEMSRNYQILLFTYKDLCSLTDTKDIQIAHAGNHAHMHAHRTKGFEESMCVKHTKYVQVLQTITKGLGYRFWREH